jgi:CHAD domain-containing protein
VRRVAQERLERAASSIDEVGRGGDRATGIHEARKDLKRTRSLLRLVRAGMKPKAYRRHNDDLRAIAHRLSGQRDADVLVKTVNGLRQRYAGRLPEHAFADLAAAFSSRAESGDRDGFAAVAAELRRAAGEAATWKVRMDAVEMADGAARAYERGRAAMRAALAAPSTDALHDWRKRVKDLGYHGRLLEAAAPQPIKAICKDADALADLLGDEHDLGVLADQLADGRGPAAGVVIDEAALGELIDDRRAELRAAAFELGRRLYAERPKAFRRRLRAYLGAAARTRGPLEPAG